MTFLNPAALLLLGLAPVTVLLHFRRTLRRRIVVPALFLWPETLPPAAPQRGVRRLRDPLSLALQLLTLLCAALAAARPVPAGDGGRAVIVADCSGRMRMAAPGLVAREAQAALARHPGAGLIAMDAAPEALLAPGEGRPDAAALRRLEEPSLAAPDTAAALALARDLLANTQGGGPGRVVWISDRPPPAAEGLEMVFRPAARRTDNIAITAFSAEPAENASGEFSGFVAVRNCGPAAWAGELRIEFDGRLHEVRELRLEPGGAWEGAFAGRLPVPGSEGARGLLTARLLDGAGAAFADALPEDNTAFAAAAPAEKRRVLVSTGGDPFFERAVLADPLGEAEFFDAAGGVPEPGARPALVALSGAAFPLAGQIARRRGVALIASGLPHGRAREPGGPAAPVRLAGRAHPVLRGVELDGVVAAVSGAEREGIAGFLRGFEAAGWTVRVLAEAGGAPFAAVGENEPAQARALFLFYDPGLTNLPLRTAFPVLIANGIRWLSERGEGPELGGQFLCGDVVPAGRGGVLLDANGRAVANPPLSPGFYQARDGAGVSRWVAVNVDAAALSLPAAEPLAENEGGRRDAEGGGPAPLAARILSGPLWQALAAGALVLLLAEWELYRRRVIG